MVWVSGTLLLMMNGVGIWDIVAYDDEWCEYLGHLLMMNVSGTLLLMMNGVSIWDTVAYDEWCGLLGHCCL